MIPTEEEVREQQIEIIMSDLERLWKKESHLRFGRTNCL